MIGFVQRGNAVLASDPPGQGERLENLDTVTGKSRAGIGVNEHLMTGVPALLTGQTNVRHCIWDGIRAFDDLLTRPEIDPKRIGVAGNSGCGTQAAYLALFEPRLATAISSCHMTSWRELWPGRGPRDSEQIWPGFLTRNLDFGDFTLALAPRPFLTTSAIRDYFPIAGARATHRQLLRLFDSLGQDNNIGFFEYNDAHGWSQPRREAVTRWLTNHFFGIDIPTPEVNIDTEEESQLYATPTGQLATSFGSRTMRDLSNSITSFTSVLETPTQQGLENTISPGILAHFDLREIVKRAAPRPVFWISTPTELRLPPISDRSKQRVFFARRGLDFTPDHSCLFFSVEIDS